ncbi:hypothetical protein AAHE18_05G179300 [Arachis hypogaea]
MNILIYSNYRIQSLCFTEYFREACLPQFRGNQGFSLSWSFQFHNSSQNLDSLKSNTSKKYLPICIVVHDIKGCSLYISLFTYASIAPEKNNINSQKERT